MSNFIITAALIIFFYLASMVALVQIKGDTSIANFTWGGGVWIMTIYTLFWFGHYDIRHFLFLTMISLWAGRLILYVYQRYTGHDPRFTEWKKEGISALIFNMAYLFIPMPIVLVIMSIPSYLINRSAVNTLGWLDFLGIGIWIFGFLYEAIADYQLLFFMRNPANKGHIMQSGLWHYSRHPNYFGEILMWWGICIFCLAVPYGYLAVISAGWITIMLCFITGIPWVEKALENNPEFIAYKQKTSALIPWFVEE